MPRLFEKKYLVDEDPLGRGGMGRVHRAVHLLLKQAVAIKFIDRETAKRFGLVRRFQIEVHSLALLHHPNIVRLIDCGETDDCFYNVMELVEGHTLREILRRAGEAGVRLNPRTALYMMAQVARAMVAAHKLGIIHRDLKPENVMVTHGGLVRVLDFGVAKQLRLHHDLRDTDETHPDRTPGTPRYMAPEQIMGKAVDGRTDVYAIGILLYELIAGCTPYSRNEDWGESPTVLMAHHLHAAARPIHEVCPCPEKVWQIILRCLEKDPERRFPSMADLGAALRSAIREIPLAEGADREARETAPEVGSLLDEEPAGERQRTTEPMPANFQPVSPAASARGPRGTTRMAKPEVSWPPRDSDEPTLPWSRQPSVTASRPTGAATLPMAGVSFSDRPVGEKTRVPRLLPDEPVPFYVMGLLGAMLGVLGLAVFLSLHPLRRRAAPSETPALATSSAPSAPSATSVVVAPEAVPPPQVSPSASVSPSLPQPSASASATAARALRVNPAPTRRRRSPQPFPASVAE